MYEASFRAYYHGVYLKSEHWKKLKEKKLKMNPLCEICAAKDIVVHHLVYKKLWDCTVEDLQTLCEKHHKKIHLEISQRVGAQWRWGTLLHRQGRTKLNGKITERTKANWERLCRKRARQLRRKPEVIERANWKVRDSLVRPKIG